MIPNFYLEIERTVRRWFSEAKKKETRPAKLLQDERWYSAYEQLYQSKYSLEI
jgi:hypothetical protein